MTKFFFYVIKNSEGVLYKGQTNNIERRLKEHNFPGSTYTKCRGPWDLVYSEYYSTRSEAMKREKYYKSGKGRDELLRKIG